ncbi:adhesion G protein-coupled receptor E5-like [Diretmus argenteus]
MDISAVALILSSLLCSDNAKTGPDGSVLTFANARSGNQGQYRCVATSSVGRSTGTAVLNVRHPPKVGVVPAGPLRVRMGEPVSVECRATGRPHPSLTWKRQGSTLQLVTTWAAVHPEDSGVYVCQAENNEGVAEVKVEMIVEGGQGAPVASVTHEELTATEGHTVTMECRSSGSPPPVITWSKLRAPLPWKHTVADGVLTLTSVGRQDSGQYICNATNIHGYSEAYTQMEVESPPYTTCLPDQVRLHPGDALRLQCLAHGSHPITFHWSRVGRAALPAAAQTTKDGKLVIAHVKLAESGTYKCVASNHIGSSEALAKVTVKHVDECEEHSLSCGNNSHCFNTPGSFYCRCSLGFHNIKGPVNFTSLNGQCKDINECLENIELCGPNAYCTNLIGSYSCTCQSGYTNLTSDGVCTDIDECEADKPHKGKVCGMSGACENRDGSYWCECLSGYTNYGNERTPCSELRCDHFKADSSPAQSLAGLTDILSLMRNSCLALSNPASSGEGKTDGDVLLKKLFTATEDLLSSGRLESSEDVSGLLGAVEDGVKLIGPQLKGNHTRKETNQTVVELAVRRGRTPPTGPIHLTNDDARMDTDWRTAAGNGTYPGFALAALVSYKNLEKSVNRSFEQITGHQKDGVDPSFQIFSKVVSAVVSNPSTQHLNPPVILTLRHLQVRENSSQVSFTCAYWRAGPDGQQEGGAWSTDGCYQQLSNATHTVCSCEHLSSFAVLMALYPMKHSFELELLTKIGLSISLLCLVLCILTFKFCRSIQGTRTTIHLHLCLCLFVADLVFLIGISRTKPEGGCRFVAALLHFFFLGVFSWMLLEGVQLYRMVVLVFNANIRPLYLFAVGYGTPFVILVVSAISRPDGYGTDQYCWLSLDHGLIWSFFGPVCLIIILNVIFFIVTVWKLAQKFSSLNPDLSKLHKIRAFTVTAIAQMCVLGLMWAFGAFLFQEGTTVAAYIFTILNSLQGALVFLMHCLLSKQVRDEYSKFFSCICTQQKRYSDFSSTNPSSSQSQASRSRQHTGESKI